MTNENGDDRKAEFASGGKDNASFSRSSTKVHDNLSPLSNSNTVVSDERKVSASESILKGEIIEDSTKGVRFSDDSSVKHSSLTIEPHNAKKLYGRKSSEEIEKLSKLNFIEPKPNDIPYKMRATKSFLNQTNRISRRTKVVDDEEEFDEKDNDMSGTPGYIALQANANIRVSRFQKVMRKVGIPKISLFFERARKQIPHQHKGNKAPIIPNIEPKSDSIGHTGSFNDMSDMWAKTHELSTAKVKRDNRKSYTNDKVIDRESELYTLSIAMMLGLKTGIGRTNVELFDNNFTDRPWLDSDAFMEVIKYAFPPGGSPITPKHNLGHTFKFKEYSPRAFVFLRRLFGVNEFNFLQSVCGNANFIQFISNAKSGQFLFYSSDGKYMIKTITTTESKFLRRILPHYFRHCVENPNTTLSRFFGMYRVKMYHLERRVKFIIMNSVFDTDKYLHSFFDLKGSSLGRESKPNETVKKDNDLRAKLPQSAICLPESVREKMREQLRNDCEFLSSMKIMDYSLLVGIHNKPKHLDGPPTICEGQVSPGGTLRSSIEVQSFRKLWNRPPLYTSQYPSICVLDDEIEVSNENESIHSASSPVKELPPPPPVTTTSPRPPLLPKRKVRRSMSAPNPRSLVTGIVQQSSRRIKTAGVSSRKINTNTTENKAVWPAIQKTPAKSPDRDRDGGSHSRDQSLSSVKIPIDTFLEATHDESPTRDINDTDTISSDGGELHPMDVIITAYENDDQSYLDNEAILSKEELNLSSQTYDTFKHNKAVITQRMYWPFHRLYTVLGERRLVESPDFKADNLSGEERIGKRLEQFEKLSKFVSPISNRKDGGFEMDMSLFSRLEPDDVPTEKIFFVGVIDILQQFNMRKRIEARWRFLQTRDKEKPSCVHPQLYADRFLRFFDDYTLRGETPESIRQKRNNTKMEDKQNELDYDGIEEITFTKREKATTDSAQRSEGKSPTMVSAEKNKDKNV